MKKILISTVLASLFLTDANTMHAESLSNSSEKICTVVGYQGGITYYATSPISCDDAYGLLRLIMK